MVTVREQGDTLKFFFPAMEEGGPPIESQNLRGKHIARDLLPRGYEKPTAFLSYAYSISLSETRLTNKIDGHIFSMLVDLLRLDCSPYEVGAVATGTLVEFCLFLGRTVYSWCRIVFQSLLSGNTMYMCKGFA